MVASSAGARTAPRLLQLPEAAAEKEENRDQGDNAFCFGRKNVVTGTTGGVSSQCRLILPLTSQGLCP